MTRINTNVSSLVAQNRLQASNKDLQTALTRLSTGLRINSGSDDPAGLIASEALRSEITSLNKSISNTRRASQIISTADSALGQVSNLLNDIRGLVVEAANSGALSPDEIAANQLQVDSSLEAINRIAQTTTFQGRKLLDGSLDFITTPGANSANVKNLKINSAGLGRTGQVDITINVRSAATQARLDIGGFVAADVPTQEGTAAAGSLTLTSSVTAPVEARTGTVSLANAGDFTLAAKAGGAFASDALDGFSVNVATVASGTASSIVVDEDNSTVTINLEEGQTLAQIATTLATNADFDFQSVAAVAVNGTDAGTDVATLESVVTPATQATSGAITLTGAGSFTLSSAAGGNNADDALNGYTVVVATVAAGVGPAEGTLSTIQVDDDAQTVTVTLEQGQTLTQIAALFADPDDGNPNFTFTSTATTAVVSGDANATAGTLDGGAAAVTDATTDISSTISITANEIGAEFNGTISVTRSATATAPTAAFANGNLTVTIGETGTVSIDAIVQAINDIGGFTATATGDLTSLDGADPLASTSVALAGGSDDRFDAIEATGSIDFQIDTTPATAAEGGLTISTESVAAVQATGGLTIEIETTPATQAASGTVTLANAGNFTLATKAGGAFGGAAGEGLNIIVSTVAAGVGPAEGTLSNISVTGSDITITLEEGQTLAQVTTTLAANADFDFQSVAAVTVDNSDVILLAAGEELTGGADAVTQTATIDITAAVGGAAFNGEVVFAQVNGTTTPTAAFADGVLTITVNDTADPITIASIVTAINDLDDFDAVADAGNTLTTFNGNDASLDVTETDLEDGADAVLETGEITITASATGEDFNGQVVFAQVAGTTTPTAAFNAETNTLTVTTNTTGTVSLAAIATAISDLDEFSAVVSGDLVDFDAADATLDVTEADLEGGEDAVTSNGSINIVATEGGAAFNGAVVFSQVAGTTTPTASYADGTLTVTVGTTGEVSLAAIATAISGLEQFTATVSATGDLATFNANDASFEATANALEGGLDDLVIGVQAAAVFELAGSQGSEVFNVSAGTTLDQLVAQVNLVSDATGIQAAAVEGELRLTSTDYGSSAKVELRVLSQGAGGNFGTGGRTLGADVVATVNGRAASGKGNELAVNTATLNMSATMENGFVGNASFSIVGGGANFQLGPDVVSNQQARIGIGSVNSARLGGVSGKLFELGSGESAALATDPTRAAEIVNEAIAQVTSLRGRLGAFQATSLDSNLVSLNDTVANLQEAESSIRDADFAAESAALTRAQILVQSGTNVLSLANQNPQNVLSLLR